MLSEKDFVAADGHRWWIDSRKCPHYNENVCAGCDFDRYYANTYPSVPWRASDQTCWCGGEVGPREPGDAVGLGCKENITHNWHGGTE